MSSQDAFGGLEGLRGCFLPDSTLESRQSSSQIELSLDKRISASIVERSLLHADHGGYCLFLNSNERAKGKTRTTLSERIFPAKNGKGFAPAALIVSGMLGLDFASIAGEATDRGRSIHHIVHLDPGSVNTFFHDLCGILCKGRSAPKRKEVIASIKTLIAEKASVYWGERSDPAARAKQDWEQLQKDIDKGKSWLSNDGRYQHIAQIIRSGNFVSKRVDITNVKKVKALMASLESAKLYLGFTYLSNISEYQATEKEHKNYRCSVKWMWRHMDRKHSLQIDCCPRRPKVLERRGGGPLVQRVIDLKKAGVYTDTSFNKLMIQSVDEDSDEETSSLIMSIAMVAAKFGGRVRIIDLSSSGL